MIQTQSDTVGGTGYTTSIVSVRDLPDDLAARMSALYLRHYDGSSESLFRRDLSKKDAAILLFFDGALAGFTSLKLFPFDWHGHRLRIVYSGDTIVAPAHWGQQQLAFAWIAHAGRLKAEAPEAPLYWLLLVKGHRTYRYLPAFSRSFHPHWQVERDDLKPLADALAVRLFGADYNPANGLIEFAQSRGHLKQNIAYPNAAELAKPATRFFLERNPGYLYGHELVCLCELAVDNLKPLAARIFGRAPASAFEHAA